jgi:EAL domain-containing protein (putative c-di-GMP-specific phosphodiesterase class I)
LSSLAHMKNLPAEYIKIDGKFIKDIAVNSSHFSTVRSINEVAHALGKKTVAEFVEDDDTLDKLKEIGVNYAQGYAISRPLPIKGLLVQLLAAPAR